MSTMGTFDAFTSARLGIYAAQFGFQVTGNNISNINTAGYTRQRLDQVSFKAGAYDMYRSQLDNHVGSGALVMNINQIRDPYLDVKFRNTNADVGYDDAMLDGLQHIADVLDEVGVGEDTNVNKKGDGRLHAQLQALSDALRRYSQYPTKENNDLVRQAADTLCVIFHTYAKDLEQLRVETEQGFNDKVVRVNELLSGIRDLNDEIRDNEIFGDNALELRDERNRQIDELSQLIHIKVIYGEEPIGNGRKVEKLSIYLDNDNPEKTVHTDEALLVDGIFGAQFVYPEDKPMDNPAYDPNYTGGDPDDPRSYQYISDATDWDGNPGDLNAAIAAGTVAYTNDVKEAYIENKKIPMGNPAFDPSYSGADPDDPRSYRYIADATDWDGKPGDLKAAIAAGKVAYTNDIKDAYRQDNDNYLLQVSKLKDDLGNEWENRITTYDVAADGQVAKKAVYQIKLTPSGWKDGDEFTLNGKTPPYVVGQDISADKMNDGSSLAIFLAQELNADTTRNEDYSITGLPGGILRFNAKQAGAVGSTVPMFEFELKGDNAVGLPIVAGDFEEKVKGQDEVQPAGYPGGTKENINGTDTITSFIIEDGKWLKVTTLVQKAYDLTLQDNDLHGSLQATRELLTEAGDFTTNYTINNVDKNAGIKRGIPYYQLSLDLMARTFAEAYNAINQGVQVDQKGNVVYETIDDKTPSQLGLLVSEENPDNGVPADFYTDKFGYFAADPAKSPNVLVDAQINAGDSLETIANKIYKADPDFFDKNNFLNAVKPDPSNENNILIDDEDQVKGALAKLLEDYGCQYTPPANPDDPEQPIEVTIPISMGGPLFSNRGDGNLTGEEGNPDNPMIDASNISISIGWSSSDVMLVPKYEVLWGGDVVHSTQNKNADHMVSLIESQDVLFDPTKLVPDAISNKLFQGSFNAMYNKMCTTLGGDQRATNVALNTHYTQLIDIDCNRDGVSGVDLNDEAMNMLQYQKAYTAACRLMTTVDEALDRLINNTGIVGR